MQPSSLRDALKLCKDFGQERHNLSVERIAERMGLEDHWVLYKWIANGRMPFVCVPSYEAACGINLATRWLAATGGKLLVDIPSGRSATPEDMVQLNTGFAHALQLLTNFYSEPGVANPAETLAALRNHLEQVAQHQANVAQHHAPELDFTS
ncbi:MAG: hypothetical protein ACKVOO_12540 [Burkholderiaceae bacterium]